MNQGILTQLPQPPAMPYGLLGRPTPVPMPAVDYALDVDAADYIRRVEAADGYGLELPVRLAVNEFVLGCKSDGIWTAIKASCILAGARTLAGALVPLVGTAPTNFNFVTGDYNRKTGLVGDESTKYLNSNRNNNADPQNNHHLAVYGTRNSSLLSIVWAGGRPLNIDTGGRWLGVRAQTATPPLVASYASMPPADVNQSGGIVAIGSTVFTGLSRTASTGYTSRVNGVNTSQTINSASPANASIFVFAINNGNGPAVYADARLAFYSIGEALDLARLDARVTTLMNTLTVVL